MYPETDIPPIVVKEEEIKDAINNIPKSWDDSLEELQKKFQLNAQLAEQIFDSQYLELFEKICSITNISPNFVASTFCSTITNLQRKGLNSDLLETNEIVKSFEFLEEGNIAKESLEMIFETIMSGKARSVEESIQKSSLNIITNSELEKIIDKVVLDNVSILQNQGQHAIGALMGIAMKSIRGKASGEKVNQLLKKKINDYLKKNQ